MLSRILKKDLQRRKGVNLILFLFITLATVFLASSINNIMVVFSAVDYYMDYAKVPDVHFITNGTSEQGEIEKWLKDKDTGVEDYEGVTMLMLTDKSIKVEKNGDEKSFDPDGAELYLSTGGTRYTKVFDFNGGSISLKDGEIALLKSSMDKNHLKPGDKLIVKVGTVKKELTVKCAFKDAAFGNKMTGMNRLFISNGDYEDFYSADDSNALGMYSISVKDSAAFEHKLGERDLKTMMQTITRKMYTMIYAFDMIMAALLILVGICLILIALLVLRFTLVFTMEEDYREIGIMKAVGFRNFAIKKVFLVKYLAIVSAGALVGLGISFPVSAFMIESVSRNMIMKEAASNLWINILCALVIVALVMLFCYASTRKLNKVSAITAIRSGSTGERFGRRKGIRLHKKSRMRVPFFLGVNDILRNVRKYILLMFTFCISFILITIPLNTLNTMRSGEMAVKFNLDPKSAVYLSNIEGTGEKTFQNGDELLKGIKKVEDKLKEKGYDASLKTSAMYFLNYSDSQKDYSSKVMTVQHMGGNPAYIRYDKGEAPKLADEVAFSAGIMEENDWKIGDTVEVSIGGSIKSLLITGIYSDYMQIGKSAKLNPKLDLSKEILASYWNIMVNMDTDKTQEEVKKEMQKQFPEYEWATAQEVVDRNVGGVQEAMNQLLLPMTALLCGVIMLITLLMEKLFIFREKGEIAMMKSMGFKNRTIRFWQIIRMACVMLVSMAAAVPLSLLNNQYMLRPIFAIMGARVQIQIVPWQVYGVYPAVLLAGIIAATIFATRSVKKINIRELNNLE